MVFSIRYPDDVITAAWLEHPACAPKRPSYGLGRIDVRALSAENMLRYRLRAASDTASKQLDRIEDFALEAGEGLT